MQQLERQRTGAWTDGSGIGKLALLRGWKDETRDVHELSNGMGNPRWSEKRICVGVISGKCCSTSSFLSSPFNMHISAHHAL